MSPTDLFDTEELLAEGSWLKTLACRLARDPAVADDAAQRAVLAGIERRGRGQGAGRGWLAAVLRNFVRQECRARRDRERHETASAREEATVSAHDVVARLDLQRRLLEAVQELSEPYRSTIALRFLEGLPPRQVSMRLGIPVKTVHTRLERGLAKLRGRLDRSYGGRGSWLSIVAPWSLSTAATGALSSLGVLLAMSTTVKWAISIVAIASMAGWFWQGGARQLPAIETADADAHGGRGDNEREDLVEVAGAVGRRIAVVVPRSEPVVSAPEPEGSNPTFEGVVIGVDGRGVSGVPVLFRGLDDPTPHLASVPSGADGSFSMELPAGRGRLVGRGNGYAPILSPGITTQPPAEMPRVVVGPERSYAGAVRDEDGEPIPGVELAVTLRDEDARRLQPGGLWGAVPVALCKSGDSGEFAFGRIGHALGMRIRAQRDGYTTRLIELPAVSDSKLVVTLRRRPLGDDALAGRVVDQYGDPVAEALVSAGGIATRSGADGRFVLEPGERDGSVLRGVAPEMLPAQIDLRGLAASDRQRIELKLGPAGRTIRGRVTDDRGRPIADAQVWTFDGVDLGRVPIRLGDMSVLMSRDVEDVVSVNGRRARSAVDGTFEIRGLVDRRGGYDLLAMHPVTQRCARMDGVEGGAIGVQLVVGRERSAAVAGRVVGPSGEPVEGARIRVSRTFFDRSGALLGVRDANHEFFAETDTEGRFRFDELAVAGTTLILGGESIATARSIALADVSDLLDVRFAAARAAHIRVLLQSDPAMANTLSLLDEQGARLGLSFMRGGVTLGADAVGIEDGRSPLIRADDSARTIVLHGRDGEVLRQPVRLEPGAVTEVRF